MPNGTHTSEAPAARPRRSSARPRVRGWPASKALLMLLVLPALQHAARADGAETEQSMLLARGHAVLRAMDCARCHGRDYRGWAAPSLIAAVREGSRERFERSVLDGDPVRGMPGYRNQPLVVAGIDAIHAYLLALATCSAASPPGASSASSACASLAGAR